VETAAEIRPEWFAGAQTVGVTAGASTPAEQIRGVIDAIEALGPDA
jgi:4-hydroxy-3-methylbut-2-enyl diphosphate reductase